MIPPRDERWRRFIYAISLAVRWDLAYWYTERWDQRGDSWREREVLIERGSSHRPDRVIARGDDFMPGADATLASWDDLQRAVVESSWAV